VAASIVTGSLIVNNRRSAVGAVAGHSVGEFAAAFLAGVVSDVDAIRLVGVRGRAMANEASKVATGMSAVLGGDPDEVVAKAELHGLTAANRNGAGQIVVAGTLEQLAAWTPTVGEEAT
jgi:[acyl-carrier-protein] S-malonyltransferase